MEEIKVGDFVRTYQGDIGKVQTVTSTGIIIEDERHIHFDRITKPSPNIIKLIEAGDYVNGHEVDEFEDDEGNMYLGFPIYDDSLMDCIEEVRPLETVDIKSIVTHEQFNSIKYEVI